VTAPGKGPRILAATAAAGLAILFPAAAAFGAAADEEPATPNEAVAAAVRWIGRQQRDDGGFDGFIPGAATPDGVLALAESAQSEPEWGNRAALERVDQQTTEGGRTPLDAARRLARGDEEPIVSARLITRVALPLGLGVDDEGPFGDLVARTTDGVTDEDLPFADRVEMALALLSAGAELPEGVIDTVIGAQQPSGGWTADGDPESEAVDLATTGAVVDLLVLAGSDVDNGPPAAALRFVGTTQTHSGAWPDEEGHPSAAATAGAMRVIRAVGHDPSGTCWQTDLGIESGDTTAQAALVALQDEDGRFAGDDTVATTSAAVHALSGRWLPRGRAAEACAPEDGSLLPFEPSLLVLGGIAVIGVGGGVRILRSAPSAY
jgi:hypothetical protein